MSRLLSFEQSGCYRSLCNLIYKLVWESVELLQFKKNDPKNYKFVWESVELVHFKKNDPEKLRICLKFRALNKVIIIDPFAILLLMKLSIK